MDLTHRQLTMFRAIMLHGNLGRAADACASSQPTLSRELGRLEQVLGFNLFDRVRGRLRPTVRALALMQEVERSFIGLEQIAVRANELRTQATGRLRIACLPALAHALVPRALVYLSHTHPELGVSVHPLESPWLEQAMSEQRFDLGLSETQEAPTGVTLQPLLKVNEVAILPRDHSLCRKEQLQPRDFTNERFISLSIGDPYRTAIDTIFEDAKVHRITLLETTSAVAICAMVRQGLGVAIVNPFTAMELSGPDLVVRSLTVAIGYQVNMLLPEIVAPHPLRSVLADSLHKASADLGHLDQCFY